MIDGFQLISMMFGPILFSLNPQRLLMSNWGNNIRWIPLKFPKLSNAFQLYAKVPGDSCSNSTRNRKLHFMTLVWRYQR